MALVTQADRGVPLSALCPKYLHSNSTSHTWPFSAIAELIDNAYDPDVSAKHFWIDKTVVQDQECLSFMDDGNGLDYETMHKMLSFGYSDKTAVDGKEPIGIYGNGFKSGSMRLGRDAIVFSKSKSTSCVGMLSQSYHEAIGAQQIIVPIVCFERGDAGEISVRDEHTASLQDILRFSPFRTQDELLAEVDAIGSSWSEGTTGTRIIVWNLRRTLTGKTEFDFEKDRYDIQIPSDVLEELNEPSAQQGAVQPLPPQSTYSLRAYCSILYLKPRLQVIIRGQKVKSQLITKTLAYVRKDRYRPASLNKPVPITFGYNTKSKDQYGVMMYHKNRLIKAYQHVGCQLKANYKGVGVIGVIECNFLDPTHNKQSFMETDKYRKMINSLGIKLEEYWEEIRHKRNTEDPNCKPVEDDIKRPDQNWTQCDKCSKWRKLPDGIDTNKLPERWYCHMNPDFQFRSCQVEEEPEDSDDEQPTYQKTYKQKQREEKKNQERKRQKDEEDRKRQEEQRVADLTRQNQVLKQEQEKLRRQLRQKPAHPPFTPSTPSTPTTPTTPRSRFNTRPLRGSPAGAESCTISQAACSPSSNGGLPVISSVCSLSAGPPRGKRPQPTTPQRTPKRPRPPNPDPAPASPPPFDDGDDTDDDIFILETASTPKPPQPPRPACDLTKVKTEPSDVGMLLECSDDAAMDVATATVSAGSGPSPDSPAPMTSITTQTEAPTLKKEAEDGGQTEVDIKQEMSQSGGGGEPPGGEPPGGVTPRLDGGDGAGPSCDNRHSPLLFPDVKEVQEQQDQLVELMQATAQERDSFKEQVQDLRRQLQEAQSRLQELVKKESSHRAVQTDPEEKDYRSLFEKAKQKVDELIRDKEVSMATAETKPGAAPDEDDNIALQVDRLLRELDRSNKEKEELRSQLDSVEEERASLASQCEELRMSLQQRRDGNRSCCVQTDVQEAGESASLIELRHNIGRLLVSYVPALDLSQVNYECNVIDEILEQVLSGEESFTPGGLTDRAINR